MSCASHSPSSADPASAAPAEARRTGCACCGGICQADLTTYYQAVLVEFVDLSRELARRAGAEARDEAARRPSAAAAVEPLAAAADSEAAAPSRSRSAARPRSAIDRAGLTLHRLGRTARLNIALSSELQEDWRHRDAKRASEQAAAETARKTRLKAQLKRLVERAIERQADRELDRAANAEAPGKFDEDAVAREKEFRFDTLDERLEEEDIVRDLGHCALGALMARICQDIGLDPDWGFWAKDHWAIEEAQSNAPGSPYARPPDTPPPGG
jgi:hypothetical protein